MICEASTHLRLELAQTARNGPLAADTEPVSGCDCPTCLTLAAGGTVVHAEHAEEIVALLAGMDPADRVQAVCDAKAELEAMGGRWLLPGPAILAALAARVPGALRSLPSTEGGRSRDSLPPLPVEDARAIPILEVAERLGLILQRVGRSYRGSCPIHQGEDLNMSIDPQRGIFKCFVCQAGGDGIELYQLVRGVDFVEAVKEIAA